MRLTLDSELDAGVSELVVGSPLVDTKWTEPFAARLWNAASSSEWSKLNAN
jgi:hypothetical protein